MGRQKHITIRTDHGKEARYLIELYRGKAAFKLMRRIMKMSTPLAGAVDVLIKAVTAAVTSGGGGLAKLTDREEIAAEMLAHLDAGGIQRILLDLVNGIGEEGDADFLCEILSCVVGRTAEGIDGNVEKGRPSERFDDFYAGNLGEAITACYHCLEHNYGASLRALAEGNGLSERVAGVFALLKKGAQSGDTASE